MTYPRPLQPKAALLESEDTTNVIGKTVTHYLTDLDQTGLP
ncbi:hypothetical protein ABIC99_003865 [Sphaerotilus sulfidivorans]|uniref:Uncharacterized protein n=1 Tax=Sphaerotilus sulfidivorans TaxID=639200 RepID=A0ABV2ISU9_9BURK|nr:hypothetical protein [Sphaerotilus sulfidivorans]